MCTNTVTYLVIVIVIVPVVSVVVSVIGLVIDPVIGLVFVIDLVVVRFCGLVVHILLLVLLILVLALLPLDGAFTRLAFFAWSITVFMKQSKTAVARWRTSIPCIRL